MDRQQLVRPTLKARLVNLAWRAFRPGSRGQKLAQWSAYIILLAVILAALTIII